MAKDGDHVIKRDGSAGLGGPRPTVTPRPSKPPAEAGAGGRFAGGYTDSHYVGWRDERAAFEAASGSPSPRQRLGRGEDIGGLKPQPANPGDREALHEGIANPLD